MKLSERRACGLIGRHRGSWRYQRKERNEVALRARLRELAAERPRFGYRRLYIFLRREKAEDGTFRWITTRCVRTARCAIKRRKSSPPQWAGKRLWKSRSVENQRQVFHSSWKSRKRRGIPTFPQPRRRRSVLRRPGSSKPMTQNPKTDTEETRGKLWARISGEETETTPKKGHILLLDHTAHKSLRRQHGHL